MGFSQTTDKQAPFFSVIIPMFNRQREIARAINSVLRQDFADFELIVVDDCSGDQSVQVVEKFSDPRIRLVRHETNKGVCPARNTGVNIAAGDWVVFLDSDDELVSGALDRLRQRICEAPENIHRIACMYRWDDGTLSPSPKPTGEVLDYEGYIRWVEQLIKSDFNNCIRRLTFEQVQLPNGRAYETIYHLDFARQFRTWLLPDVIALEHQDAADRISSKQSRPKAAARLLRDAPDNLQAEEIIISVHGEAFRQHAPTHWRLHHRIRILFAFLSGRRKVGLLYAIAYFRQFGIHLPTVAATALGLFNPKLLAWVQASR